MSSSRHALLKALTNSFTLLIEIISKGYEAARSGHRRDEEAEGDRTAEHPGF